MSLDGLNGLFMRNMYDGLPSFSLAWPETWRERITYLIILPIIIPLWLTLPDTRKPSGAALLLLNLTLSLMMPALPHLLHPIHPSALQCR